MANKLAEESSPYLLQHAENPVDWHPWGPEALARARDEDRPILLSIGYSSCHWCHVMERESFEDEATAAYMNEHFVCIKVDREERPDVDAIYMEAVQAMTGHGGWPLTAFLDTETSPFYCGTYYPPEPRHGMPSFRMVMEAVVASWEGKRAEIAQQAGGIRERLAATGQIEPMDGSLSPALLEEAERLLVSNADPMNGGFGGAPKFPPASAIEFLLARGERGVAGHALDGMLAGGIFDQVGGGFARYSVDANWLVPHFEKMLYDNALLARAYLHGFQAQGHERWRVCCERTLEWMLREMRGPEGGFYSALDADSEGVEGRFYVWSEDELREVLGGAGLGGEADELVAYWGVSAEGNFEGQNILHLAGGARAPAPPTLEAAQTALYDHRAKRVWPGLDDKRITSWNALAIAALADAGAVLDRPDFTAAARTGAEFLWEKLRDKQGRLLRTWKDGEAKILGLPGGPRVRHRGAAGPLRVDVRGALVRRRARDGRRDDRALRRPRAWRLLHDRQGRRGADRAAEGHRRPPHPLGQLVRCLRPPAHGGPDRRAQLRRARPLRLRPHRARRRAPPSGGGAPLAGDRLRPRPGEGGRAGGLRP